MSRSASKPANNATRLVMEGRRRSIDDGIDIQSVPSEVVGAYGERVAARLLGAQVVSGPGVDDHDLMRNGCKIEVKSTLGKPKHIGDLRGKVRDRVAYVQLELVDGRLLATACSFYDKSGADLGRRPGRVGFVRRAVPIALPRPIRLPWRTTSI